MCKFCEKIRNYEEYKDYLMRDGILYNKESGKYCIVANYLIEDFEDGIAVNFCPMCGRKLSKVSENGK